MAVLQEARSRDNYQVKVTDCSLESEGAVIYKSCTRFTTNIIIILLVNLCLRHYDGQMHVMVMIFRNVVFHKLSRMMHAKPYGKNAKYYVQNVCAKHFRF